MRITAEEVGKVLAKEPQVDLYEDYTDDHPKQ